MTKLTGRAVYPGDPGWDDARRGFARWADYEAHAPRAVVFCQTAQDAANAVRWAVEQHVPLRVRSGRHSYEAYSSLVDGGIIIDVSELDTLAIDRENRCATVGAGICMMDLFEKMGQVGVTFPAATGPTVGLAGLALGGGFGVTSRLWGLTCDNILEAEMVDARGEIVIASEQQNPDLYWALRGGGGGNFGIVTSLRMRTHMVQNAVVFSITYPWSNFDTVVQAWQTWAPGSDDRITSFLTLLSTGAIIFQGQFTAPDDELGELLGLIGPVLFAGAPLSVSFQTLPFVAATRVVLGVDPMQPQWQINRHNEQQIFKSTSALAYEPFPPEAIQILKTALETLPPLSCAPSQPSMVQLLGGGGAPARISTDATAVVHRAAKFIVQYDAYWTAPEDSENTIAWAQNLRTALLPYTRGAYVNYVDANLADPLRAYYGENLERLVEVKRTWDPENVFQFPQSVPVSLT